MNTLSANGDIPYVIALIVAGGTGSRIKSALPKQYMEAGGHAVLRHTIQTFLRHPLVSRVQLVIHPQHALYYHAATQGLNLPAPVHGGESRQASVRNGLEALAAQLPANQTSNIVLIHDAARPFTSAELISQVIDTARQHPAVIPALPVSDTLKQVNENQEVTGTTSRDGLWQAQTPQAFHFSLLLDAHRNAAKDEQHTDDASIMEAAGHSVHVVKGSSQNMKITTMGDLVMARKLLGAQHTTTMPHYEYRSASGYDVHRFADKPANAIRLGGIDIPFNRPLEGHSDADVILHALTDALLGTIGAEDIGFHFSPKDTRWKDADSATFFTHACQLVREKGGEPTFLDVTFIGEAPKVGPHRETIRARIAELATLPTDRVSVKATTTEKLGFTGREEGLAAQATATIKIAA